MAIIDNLFIVKWSFKYLPCGWRIDGSFPKGYLKIQLKFKLAIDYNHDFILKYLRII